MKIFNYGYSKLPERKHKHDVGYDIYLKEDLRLPKNSTIKVGCGFGIELKPNTMAQIIARSSIAVEGIILGNSPIDPGYQGEVHMIITNTNRVNLNFKKGDRLAQLVIMPVLTPTLEEAIITDETERGTNGFGSTNT